LVQPVCRKRLTLVGDSPASKGVAERKTQNQGRSWKKAKLRVVLNAKTSRDLDQVEKTDS